MQKIATLLTIGAAAFALAGCASSGVNPPSASRVCNLGANVLQMNVGTATLPSGGTGTNVAVTYRQGNSANCYVGNSGSLVSTPTLTVPAAAVFPATGTADAYGATILTGPAAGEAAAHALTSIPQLPVDTNNTAATATFGDDGGAFGLGLEPFNYASTLGTAGVAGVPATVFPYPVPVYDTVAAPDINQFTPGGGPPAFNPLNNTAATLAGFNGISEGFDVFGGLTPAVGTYSLSVAVPANTGTVTATATSAVTAAAPVLPPVVAPVPTSYTASSGVLTFGAQVFPVGVTQEYIQVTDIGPTTAGAVSCIGATPAKPVYYTTVLTAAGTPTPIPAPGLCSAAANTTATGSASDGDEFGVQLIGLDYNWYGASYTGISGVGGLGVPAPSLTGTGAAHQADITISPLTEYTLPGGNVIVPVAPGSRVPLAVRRR
jgi:hypothetical protein